MAQLAVIGAGLGAFGSIVQGDAASAASKYNAAMGFANAQAVRENTTAQAKEQARDNYLRMGDMRVAAAKSGGIGGSALDVMADTAAQGELQKQQIVYAGEVRATNITRQALLDQVGATTAKVGGYLAAGSELLRGAGNYNTPRRA